LKIFFFFFKKFPFVKKPISVSLDDGFDVFLKNFFLLTGTAIS